MENPKILVVDDEPNIRKILQRTLACSGWETETACEGQEAITKVGVEAYDLILLDLYMDSVDGLAVLERIKEVDPDTVVIILTAHGSLDSAVDALRLGAYDYLLKPAAPESIQARVKEGLAHRQAAVQRRRLISQIEALKNILADLDETELGQISEVSKERFLKSRELVIDRAHRTAVFREKLLDLTATEFDALVLLVQNSPQPVSPGLLVRHALGYEAQPKEACDIIKWHIHQLRTKIEPTQAKPRYILNVRNQGYLWAGE